MKTRICFLTDSIFSIGGVQRVTAVIAKALAPDFDVTIVTFDKPADADYTLYDLNEADISYRFFEYPQTGKIEKTICRAYSGLYQKLLPQGQWASWLYGHSSFPPTIRRALVKELQAGGYNIIIGVHAPLAARLATMKSQLPGVTTIGWVHNSYEALFGVKFRYIGAGRKRHYVYQFRRLHHVVLLCHHDAQMYQQYDPLFTPTVIHNPLTLKPGLPSQGNSRRFLAIGRFSQQHKGFDLLIEAFHLFARHNSEWTLDIVGEGREQELLESLISQYGLQHRVTIHPFTNNIQQYYSQAQVYVLSSRWEGFGLVLVEAMAHGLPVVSSDLPTSIEIMGPFALYFRNGDSKHLAQQLEAATHIDWSAKSAEALQLARNFDIGQIAAQWRKLLTTL